MVQTPRTTVPTEADQAREDVAARLEGLVRHIRCTTTQDVDALDAAYSDVVKLAHQLKRNLATNSDRQGA